MSACFNIILELSKLTQTAKKLILLDSVNTSLLCFQPNQVAVLFNLLTLMW